MVGLNDAELRDFGGDAGGIAKAIASKGSLSLWQYAVTQKDGERMVAPQQKDRRSCERLASGRALQATVQSAAARVSEPCLGFNSVASTRDDRLVSNFNPNNHVPPGCTISALGSFCQIGLPLSWV